MIKPRQFIYSVIVSIGSLLLTSCKLAILQPKGMIAVDEKNILYVAVALMMIVVVPVIALTFYYAWKYREGNEKANYQPNWAHNNLIEIICWGVPLIIIGILGTITWISTHKLDPYRPLEMDGKPLTVQVIALEWKWLFIYPEQKIAAINYVKIPVNRQIKFLITSEGPMNSIQIPELAGQIYAMAGMQTKLHLVANKTGEFRGLSTNYSGHGFTGMKFVASASSEKEFNRWVKKTQNSQNKLDMKEYKKLLGKSTNDPKKLYSLADDGIYHYSIMKYMMPMDHAHNKTHSKR